MRVLMVAFALAVVTLPAAVSAASTTLYVDRANPNCSNSGAGTLAQPFCTIGAAAPKATAGMTVLVSAGTYNEQVSITKSGTAIAPVLFKPEQGETVTVTGQKYGFYVSGRNWVTIQGFNVSATTGNGVHVSSGSTNVKVIGNDISTAGKPISGQTAKGISVTDARDVLVQGNSVHHISYFGIYLENSTATKVVENEVFLNARVYQRAASGIRLHSSSGNTISSNVSHDNEDSGIEVVTGSNDNLVVNNVTYENGDHGIDVLDSLRARVVSNSVYDNITAGINVEGTSTGATVTNNISVDNGINSPRTTGNIRVDSTSISGTAIDYDQVYLRTSGAMFVWGNTTYSSRSALTAATGQESHGIEADPRWTNRAAGDFHLEPGSLAIDSANSSASGHLATDAEGKARVDVPATPNTGVGPRTYDDRGAYEFQLEDAPPNAALAVTPPSGLVDLSVSADASGSSDNDGLSPIASYTFNFGDGSAAVGPQAGATAVHTYTGAGTYTVTVTVTDTAGLSSTATKTVTVTDDPPAAALTVTPESGLVDLTVSADASGSADTDGTPIANYRFDFGDGSPAVGPQGGPTAAHTYTGAGTYTVTVTVTDTAGLSSTATDTVTVTDNPPTANLSVTPSSGIAPLSVTADASASSDSDGTPIASYTFDFGDGSPAVGPQEEPTATHLYTTGGTHTVTVTVTDTAGLSSEATQPVVVSLGLDNPPSAALSVTPESGLVDLAVSADASASSDADVTSPIASYAFDFGDGSPTVGPQPGATAAHTYTGAGTYTITVTVTDTAGLASTATDTVTVTDDPPAAALTVTPDSGLVDLAVTADASGSADTDGTPIASYRFDFGDGSPAVGPQAAATSAHTYTAAGTYTVTVTVTDTAGLASTATKTVTVTDDPPNASLSVTPSSGLAPLTVTADASGSSDNDSTPIASYTFDFGDGSATVGPQAQPTATHVYTTGGTHTVTVTVTDTAGLASTASAQVDARTNFVLNPGFETNTSGWNTSGSGSNITLARVSTSRSGSFGIKLTNTGTTASTCSLNDSPDWVKPSSAGTYAGSLWVKGDTAGATLKLRFREWNGGTLAGTATTQSTLTTTWQQITVNYTTLFPGSSLDFNAYVSSAAPGTCFYADDASIFLD